MWSLRAMQLLIYERDIEMREVLRGEIGWEREIPGTAALSSLDPFTVLDPRGGARDGEVVARATSLVPAPQRGLHTPAREREREREWERPSRWRRRECVRRGVEVLVAGREVGEVGEAPGDER